MENSNKTKNQIIFMLYSLCLGIIIGLIVWAFLTISNIGIDLIWHKGAELIKIPFYTIIVCVLGGIIIGVVQKKYKGSPETMHEVIGKVKKDGRYSYKDIKGILITALLPLFFGGSVGFEAGLVGLIAALCTWVGDKFQNLSKEIKELTQIGISATLGTIFRAPMFGFMEPLEDSDEEEIIFPKKAKIVLYFLCILGALGAFLVLTKIFNTGSGLAKFTDISINTAEMIGLIPLGLIGVLGGILFVYSKKWIGKILTPLKDYTIIKGIIGGLLLGIAGFFLPWTMFSGEKEMEELLLHWQEIGAIALILTGVIKLLITNICMDTGFKGGDILPAIFAGLSIGYGVGVLTGLNPVFCASIIATALIAYVMKTPIAIVLLMMMFFPINAMPYVLCAAILGAICTGDFFKKKDNKDKKTIEVAEKEECIAK